MRNWNPSTGSHVSIGSPCFQRTYEELKQTYRWSEAHPNKSFQRTYEELKLLQGLPFGCMLIVFSVPMRNWNNSLISISTRSSAAFSAYLWGIETRKYVRKIGFETAFSAYLWGIETQSPAFPEPYYLRFQRTYEELKPLGFAQGASPMV